LWLVWLFYMYYLETRFFYTWMVYFMGIFYKLWILEIAGQARNDGYCESLESHPAMKRKEINLWQTIF